MNRWMGIGRWTRDIELRYTKSGKAVASGTLAVSEKAGGQEQTVFVPIIMWDKRAENVAKYSGKGRLVYVEGRLTSREYENRDGKNVKAWEVVASDVVFLDRAESKPEPAKQAESVRPYGDDPFKDDAEFNDDDLPF